MNKNNTILIIEIYTGESIDKEDAPRHPLSAVRLAKQHIDSWLINKSSEVKRIYTNSPDFASMLDYYSQNFPNDFKVRFFLDNNEVDGLEQLFEDWNRALDYISENCKDYNENKTNNQLN